MSNRDYREIQVASSLLAVIFVGVLALGVFVFLLGVSVGKKQAEAVRSPGPAAHKVVETVKPPAVPAAGPRTETAARPTEAPAGPGAEGPSVQPAGSKLPASPAVSPQASPAVGAPAAKTPGTGAPASAAAKQTAQAAGREAPPDAPAGKPAAKTAAPQAPAAKPLARGRWYVQVGAYDDRPSAQNVSARFKSLGYQVVILDPLATDKKPKFRVRIGGYETRDQAGSVLARLKMLEGGKSDYWVVQY